MTENAPIISTVAVLGGGLMGSGIAQACAQAGYETIVRDISTALCDAARASIEKSFNKAIERGTTTVDVKAAAMARVRFTTDLGALAGADLAIEAVVEDLGVKRELFRTLDGLCPAHTMFASNTSSLTVTEIAAATGRADRCVGLHFFNPVPVMPLVEVVRALHTSDETMDRAAAFAMSLGKTPVRAKDTSGFIVNLLLVPFMLDAVRALEAGVASVADIDAGMRLGAGHPMGPLTLLDFVGLDTAYKIAEIMFSEYREARYAPPPLLKRMVAAGLYGKKSKMGFYDYSTHPPVPNDLGV